MGIACGNCRLGSDPARSVVNQEGRSQEVANLWIADGSILSGCPAVGRGSRSWPTPGGSPRRFGWSWGDMAHNRCNSAISLAARNTSPCRSTSWVRSS